MRKDIRYRSERGAVLVVSLILLLIMTILAIAASQSTRLQEREAGNTRDSDLAFQAAETALRNGENLVAIQSAPPFPCSALGTPCNFYYAGILPPALGYQTAQWWKDNGRQYGEPAAGTKVANKVAHVAEDPRSVVEELETIPAGPVRELGIGLPARTIYRVTGHGTGGSTSAEAVIESTYSRP